MTLPLWTLPIPIIVLSLIDWALEAYRKIAAGRFRYPPPRGLTGSERLGGDIPRVTVLRRTGDQ